MGAIKLHLILVTDDNPGSFCVMTPGREHEVRGGTRLSSVRTGHPEPRPTWNHSSCQLRHRPGRSATAILPGSKRRRSVIRFWPGRRPCAFPCLSFNPRRSISPAARRLAGQISSSKAMPRLTSQCRDGRSGWRWRVPLQGEPTARKGSSGRSHAGSGELTAGGGPAEWTKRPRRGCHLPETAKAAFVRE